MALLHLITSSGAKLEVLDISAVRIAIEFLMASTGTSGKTPISLEKLVFQAPPPPPPSFRGKWSNPEPNTSFTNVTGGVETQKCNTESLILKTLL